MRATQRMKCRDDVQDQEKEINIQSTTHHLHLHTQISSSQLDGLPVRILGRGVGGRLSDARLGALSVPVELDLRPLQLKELLQRIHHGAPLPYHPRVTRPRQMDETRTGRRRVHPLHSGLADREVAAARDDERGHLAAVQLLQHVHGAVALPAHQHARVRPPVQPLHVPVERRKLPPRDSYQPQRQRRAVGNPRGDKRHREDAVPEEERHGVVHERGGGVSQPLPQ
mmetsp:Transcript_225/g.517  ORF Transcript_225/g.517 Transcript_225/m.517 type:complete len:226 (+) Transcript_225:113-790(+)